jgi:hypothetical protein
MGKSAKMTRGGNKHRVNVGRQKAKLAAAGIKDHTAYDHAALAAAAAVKSRAEDGTGASATAGRDAVKQQMAASLKAIQRQREQQRLNSTAVKMAPRPKKAAPSAGKKEAAAQ